MTKSNYMEQLDRWIDDEIDKFYDAVVHEPDDGGGMEAFQALKSAIKDKVLESYRNGLRARRPRENEPSEE